MISMIMTGCGKSVEEVKSNINDKAVEAVTEVMADNATADEAASVEETADMPDYAHSDSVVLAGNVAYYIGASEIVSLDLTTGKSEVVWIEDSEYRDMYALNSGAGILLKDNLYFTRTIEDAGSDSYHATRQLNKLNLLDNSFEQVVSYSADNYCSNNMYYADGILYADLNGINDCFEIDDDGNIVRAMNRTETEEYKMVPEGYTLATYEGATKTLFPKESYSQNGMLILYNADNSLVSYDPVSGRETELGGYLNSVNDKSILINSYESGEYRYGLINRKTGEYKYLTNDEYLVSIGIDDEYVYYCETDDSGADTICRMSLDNGRMETVCALPQEKSRLEVSPSALLHPVMTDDYVFIVESHDCGLYPAAVNLNTSEIIVGDNWYYQSGVAQIGTMVRKSASSTAPDGQVLINARCALINITENFAGAERINDTMEARMDEFIARATDNHMAAESWYNDSIEFAKENDSEVYFVPFSFTESIDDLDYMKDNIICFRINGYDYLGGAHGTPYYESFIFDLNTGNRLKAGDFIDLTEEELKNKVLEAVVKRMNEEGRDLFWEDAEESVYNIITPDYANAYLSENGIVFYFDPYLIASYAQGFIEIEIPYSELQKEE